MTEVLATLIVLILMIVPGLNILVGALAFGWVGFAMGLAVTMVYAAYRG